MESPHSKAFRCIIGVMRDDGNLLSAVNDSWQDWTGNSDSIEPPSTDSLPWLRVRMSSPQTMPYETEGWYKSIIDIAILTAVAGYKDTDAADFWEIIHESLHKNNATEDDRNALHARYEDYGILKLNTTKAAIGDVRGVPSAEYMVCMGTVQIEILHK